MRNRKGIPKVGLVSKPPRIVIASCVSNRKLSIVRLVRKKIYFETSTQGKRLFQIILYIYFISYTNVALD